MGDFFYQLVMLLVGALIGVAVPLLKQKQQQKVALAIALLLIVSSLAWASYVYGYREGRTATVEEIAGDPKLVPAAQQLFFDRANENLDNNRIDQAIEQYGYALRLGFEPRNKIFAKLGIAYFQKGAFVEAVEYFNNAIDTGYTPIGEAITFRGDTFRAMGDHPAAIADFTRLINTSYGDVSMSHLKRAASYCSLKEYSQAQLDYDKAIESGNLEAYRWSGWCYRDQGDHIRAIDSYSKGIELTKKAGGDEYYSYFDRAMSFKALNQNADAIKDLEYFVSLGGRDPNFTKRAEDELKELRQ